MLALTHKIRTCCGVEPDSRLIAETWDVGWGYSSDKEVIMADKVASVEEYLDGVNPEFRSELERIREFVTHLVPGLEETISYRMPTLK